ncbi:hypothetical protein [Mesorhizobium sp. M1273]|uniref:hypothetical protein n=1 Tax=Mesorhizobium sp. M1273 TaxID=2957075 RepID=UPI0033377F64
MPAGIEVVVPAPADYLSRYETTYADLEPDAREADAFIGWTAPTGILEIAEKLKILSWLHVGVDDLRQIGAFSLLAQRKTKLANIAEANAIAIAEHMMLMLALAKNAIIKHQIAVDGRSSFPVWGMKAGDRRRQHRRPCRKARKGVRYARPGSTSKQKSRRR